MASEKSDKASEMSRTTTLDEAAGLLRQIAGDGEAGESVKGVFRRLQRKLTGWSPGRIRDVWYRDRRVRIRAEEVEQLRALAKSRSESGSRDELTELRNRIARLERLLEAASAPVHG
ncbi:hypothetical protein XI02_13775 [Bradyrhizobium sp. CCBAU 21365]|uniref:hypothetical protein n=1 Tax=Bradyrhizobium sp. CCBAU 21365 TaxID=1325083 RepID=UPI00188C6C2F|nr:hypothetical protein [Bradyrhizobium sp. CCBAU 21365]QOZ15927.1 hypothetical protein XI02_13775 [Bradyrhizobium sp. CCBAU 21365]